MLRLDPTSDGGFYVYNDYGADLGSGIFGGIVFIIYLIAILNPFVNNPKAFGGALTALILGLAIVFFISEIEGLFFLRPLALPFLCYSLASTAVAMVENVSPSLGLLMFVAIPFVILVMNIVIFSLILGAEMMALPILINFIFMTYGAFAAPDTMVFFYLMRVIEIGSIILSIIILIDQIKTKEMAKAESLMANFGLIFLGILGFIALMLIVSIIGYNYSLVTNIIYVLITLVTFIALTIIASNIIVAKKSNLKGSFEALSFALFIAAVFLFSITASNNIGEEIIGYLIRSIYGLPFATNIASTIYTLSMAFGNVLGLILSGIINLVLMIFDFSIPVFAIPYPFAYVLMLIIVNITISLTLKIIKK